MPPPQDLQRSLREMLARLYPTQDAARVVAEAAGLDILRIGFDNRAYITWAEIIREANLDGKVKDLIEAALQDKPGHIGLGNALDNIHFTVREGPSFEEPHGPQWQGPTSAQPFEKILGAKSSLVPVNFLSRGLEVSRAVALIECGDGGLGTGFLVAHNVLITNWHVLGDEEAARRARVHFNYQLTSEGLPTERQIFTLAPESGFKTSKEHDWTAVKLNGDANEDFGAIGLLSPEIKRGERVNIIQHPGGGSKMLSYYHNIVVYVGGGRVQYLTDTEPGSSGAPVFDREWRLVAVHHSGGWLPVPGTNQTFYRNEGIDISIVRQELENIESFNRD